MTEQRNFDFEEPTLPQDLVDQLFVERRGVPEHWTLRERRSALERHPEVLETRTPVYDRGPARALPPVTHLQAAEA